MRTFPSEIRCTGPRVNVLEAAEGGDGLRRFDMVAYSGGPMNPSGFGGAPVVVDLAGMRGLKGSKPILLDHNTALRVGHTEQVTADGGVLKAYGPISAASASSAEVEKSSLNKFPWQASIGARIFRVVELAEGKTATVNGQVIQGPAYIVRSSELKEISFVTLGADSSTSATVHAALAADTPNLETYSMKFEDWIKAMGLDVATLDDTALAAMKKKHAEEIKAAADLVELQAKLASAGNPPPVAPVPPKPETDPVANLTASYAAEAGRLAEIAKICASNPAMEVEVEGKKVNLQAHAISEKWDVTRTRLEAKLAGRVEAPSAFHFVEKESNGRVLECALAQAGNLHDIEKSFDDKTMQAAHTAYKGQIGLQQILLAAAWVGGFAGRHFDKSWNGTKSILQAAFSSASLPGVLSNTANKFLLQSFLATEQTYKAISASRNVGDFKTATSYRINADMKFEKVQPSGELKHGEVGESKRTNKAETRGKIFVITREMMVNDDLGALTDVPKHIGRGAGLSVNEVFWTCFLANLDSAGAAFFSAGNKNYIEGADTVLSIDSLTQAEMMFLNQVDERGFPIGIMPATLLVPNILNVPANQLMKSTELRNTTGSTKYLTQNPHAGKFGVERSSYLNNAALAANPSATGWYMLANPDDEAVIEIAYLNGVEVPTIETAEADFNVLGIQMRGVFDFGVAMREPRAGVKVKGAA